MSWIGKSNNSVCWNICKKDIPAISGILLERTANKKKEQEYNRLRGRSLLKIMHTDKSNPIWIVIPLFRLIWISVWCKINRESAFTIEIGFALTRFKFSMKPPVHQGNITPNNYYRKGGEYSIKPPFYGSVNLKAPWVFQRADVTDGSVHEYEQ